MEPTIFTPQTIYCADCLEVERMEGQPAGTDDSPVHIIPVAVDELLTETFKLELLLLQGWTS